MANVTRSSKRLLLFMGIAGLALAAAACKGGTQLAFKGRCTDARGKGIQSFMLAVAPAGAQASPAGVKAGADGQYSATVGVSGVAAPTGSTLGARDQQIEIRVTANGYKPKTFTVGADRLLLGEPNVLNVNLEAAQ